MVSVTTAVAPLKTVVVADDASLRRVLREGLQQRCGHEVLGEAVTATEMIRTALSLEPEVIVFDVRLRDGSGLEALRQIYQERPVGAVAIAEEEDQEMVRQALSEYQMAYLIKPVAPHQLEPAVMVAWARLNTCRRLQNENASLRQTLENRKLIERAKGVLMKRLRCSEDVAFRRLQRAAMNRRTTMAALAQSVLNGVEVDL
ncbi:MAG TPA: ANTAR domain-containing protein [Gemmataceae bacterium]|nr:ANTAR domain-containing protein [Gemmataceae bacterium]